GQYAPLLHRSLPVPRSTLPHLQRPRHVFLRNDLRRRRADYFAYQAIAAEAGCSPAQLALAWLLQRGGHIIPIPGTTSVEHLHDNLGADAVTLNASTLQQLDDLINPRTVHGGRYNAQAQADVDTEEL
ncbi:aldo/keto reductase, partial [Rhodoferax sp. U2-2l]|uniref:aldo/keto reductase n=1 Tax=Rhodoferax sp. U2-2l TaxID=2884000 RepID=UPI001D0AA458